MMTMNDFVAAVVDKGQAAAREHYVDPRHRQKLAGSLAGFEACRGQSIGDLATLLAAARDATRDARERQVAYYWWFRCYELEVEWVCNCVSVLLHQEGIPTIVPPTARAAMTAAAIVGVAGQPKREGF